MRLNIKYFIVTSALVHATLFVAWTSTASHTLQIPFATASAPVFNVALHDDIKPLKPAPAHGSGHKADKSQHKTKPVQHRLIAKPDATETTPLASATTARAVSPHQAELHSSEIRDRVLSRIRSNLQQYFIYPLLAQRQGWQGRVLLGFSVEANGVIRNIHIAAGSGYPILDTSAVDALSRVPHLYEASDWLQGKRLELQMPVIFRLQGG